MIKISKNLLIFSVSIFFLGILSFIVMQKLLPLATHTIYYCRSVIESFSFSIPHYISIIPLIFVFLLFFGAIAKLCAVYLRVQTTKTKLLKEQASNNVFTALLNRLNIEEKTYLIKSEKRFAFCLGIKDPKIYISTSLVRVMSEREIEAILRHEIHHLKNRDSLIMLVASVLQSFLPFFPLLSDVIYNYRVEQEIRADTEASQGLGDRKPLIEALKKMLVAPQPVIFSASSIADHDTLEPRIYALVKKKLKNKTLNLERVILSIVSLLVMTFIVIAPVQAFEVHSKGEDMMMLCPLGKECAMSCEKKSQIEQKKYSENKLFSSPNNP